MKKLKLLGLGLCGVIFLSTLGIFQNKNRGLQGRNIPVSGNVYIGEELPPSTQARKKIKIALLLDTSGSMDGLIDQAKSQLWNIVNEMAMAKSGGQSPDLEIALYQYGNDGLSQREGYIRQETAFTSDLDVVSEKLFGLTTNGGSEYCGQVIHKSLNDLEWGKDYADYKTVFIAGNEEFGQGGVHPDVAFNLARKKGVFVNTIYCGNNQQGLNEGWNATTQAAIGAFLNIDSDQQTVYITTPYDDKINALNSKLNDTYVRYGASGNAGYMNMNVQDDNAKKFGAGNAVNRALMKNGDFYQNRNESWDLVDRLNVDPNFNVKKVDPKTLPKEMQKMNDQEKAAYVREKQNMRASINKQIAELGELRTRYIATQKLKNANDASLEGAMISSIQAQARQKGWTFGNEIGMAQVEEEFVPALVDMDYFMEIAQKVKRHRKDRLVDFNLFLAMAQEPGTVILDTRSKENYDAMHIKGAIHINFSAFNAYDLARLIPDKNTRILIYCNNNIDTNSETAFSAIPSEAVQQEIQRAMVSKAVTPRRFSNQSILKLDKNDYTSASLDPTKTMALNIPTFINLYGYGYENVYELSQLVKPSDPRLELEGSSIPVDWTLNR